MGALHEVTSEGAPRPKGVPSASESVQDALGAFDADNFVESFTVLAEATSGIERLRDIVLQMALRGSLVRQVAGDQPASFLLAHARSQLGASRKMRQAEALPTAPHELPVGWVWCQAQQLGVVAPRNDVADRMTVGFVPMPLVPIDYRQPVGFETRAWGEIKKGYTHVADGDVAVAKITPCFQNKKSCVIRDMPSGIAAGTTELLVLRPVPGVVVPEYLLLFFKSPGFISGGTARMTGTAGQQRVPADYFAAAPLPLPPLAEQKRIVARVDQLMALIDELEAKQTRKREVGKRFTKASLEALTSAKGPEEFDAACKRVVRHWEAVFERSESVNELRHLLRALSFNGRLTGLHNVSLESVERLADAIVDCPHSTPKWSESGIICLRTTNFRVEGLALSEVRYVSRATYDERIARLKPQPGDVVYSREGGILGIACVIPDIGPVCLGQRMMLLRPAAAQVLPEFLALMLNAPQTRQEVERLTGGTASPHLNVGDVRRFRIPVPSLPEQKRIVAKVAQLMRLCDELEAKLRRAEDRASKLVEAVVQEMVG